MNFIKNAMVSVVLRPGSKVRDRFGTPRYLRVYQGVPVRITKARKITRGQDGDVQVADAVIYLEAAWTLEPGDVVKFDWPRDEVYTVLSMDEGQSITGMVVLRTYMLGRNTSPIIAIETTTTTTTSTSTTTVTTTETTESTTALTTTGPP